ncbi:TIGR02452 family protein [Agarilytica rhodophyticola]|uniref:TIGR02452 family protein n=1 Tax=Agarilytica rhodophyticola TaxID=1737490 RepID=UPI000B349108|nr:TIGR02452 family protein [Agarilytica rhodophyticola]
MTNRTERAQIAQETIRILEERSYKAANGKIVDLTDSIKGCVANSIHYTPESLLELVDTDVNKSSKDNALNTCIEVANETTFSGAKCLLEKTSNKVICLNFASAKNPGGGFLGGSQAQEEALTRASALYASLTHYMSMYLDNRKFKSCLYQDHIIYSPAVPVFRDDNDKMLESPWCTSIITAPAVNYGSLKQQEKSLAEKVMKQRINMVLAIAYEHGYTNIVLGAWGCGVFRNDPALIARYFQHALSKEGIFHDHFENIRFSVLDSSNDQHTFNIFKDTLVFK